LDLSTTDYGYFYSHQLDATTDYGCAWTSMTRQFCSPIFGIDYRLRLWIKAVPRYRLQITAVLRGERTPIDYKLRLLPIDYRFVPCLAIGWGGWLWGPFLLGSRA